MESIYRYGWNEGHTHRWGQRERERESERERGRQRGGREPDRKRERGEERGPRNGRWNSRKRPTQKPTKQTAEYSMGFPTYTGTTGTRMGGFSIIDGGAFQRAYGMGRRRPGGGEVRWVRWVPPVTRKDRAIYTSPAHPLQAWRTLVGRRSDAVSGRTHALIAQTNTHTCARGTHSLTAQEDVGGWCTRACGKAGCTGP